VQSGEIDDHPKVDVLAALAHRHAKANLVFRMTSSSSISSDNKLVTARPHRDLMIIVVSKPSNLPIVLTSLEVKNVRAAVFASESPM
jgi:hypothetical protein